MKFGNKVVSLLRPTFNQRGFWHDRIDSTLSFVGLGFVMISIESIA
jgi:hypothetical protein